MKRSRFTEEQIASALRQHKLGAPVREICRELGISEGTFFHWQRRYAGLSPSELRDQRLREEQDAKIKRLRAEISAYQAGLPDVFKRKP